MHPVSGRARAPLCGWALALSLVLACHFLPKGTAGLELRGSGSDSSEAEIVTNSSDELSPPPRLSHPKLLDVHSPFQGFLQTALELAIADWLGPLATRFRRTGTHTVCHNCANNAYGYAPYLETGILMKDTDFEALAMTKFSKKNMAVMLKAFDDALGIASLDEQMVLVVAIRPYMDGWIQRDQALKQVTSLRRNTLGAFFALLQMVAMDVPTKQRELMLQGARPVQFGTMVASGFRQRYKAGDLEKLNILPVLYALLVQAPGSNTVDFLLTCQQIFWYGPYDQVQESLYSRLSKRDLKLFNEFFLVATKTLDATVSNNSETLPESAVSMDCLLMEILRNLSETKVDISWVMTYVLRIKGVKWSLQGGGDILGPLKKPFTLYLLSLPDVKNYEAGTYNAIFFMLQHPNIMERLHACQEDSLSPDCLAVTSAHVVVESEKRVAYIAETSIHKMIQAYWTHLEERYGATMGELNLLMTKKGLDLKGGGKTFHPNANFVGSETYRDTLTLPAIVSVLANVKHLLDKGEKVGVRLYLRFLTSLCSQKKKRLKSKNLKEVLLQASKWTGPYATALQMARFQHKSSGGKQGGPEVEALLHIADEADKLGTRAAPYIMLVVAELFAEERTAEWIHFVSDTTLKLVLPRVQMINRFKMKRQGTDEAYEFSKIVKAVNQCYNFKNPNLKFTFVPFAPVFESGSVTSGVLGSYFAQLLESGERMHPVPVWLKRQKDLPNLLTQMLQHMELFVHQPIDCTKAPSLVKLIGPWKLGSLANLLMSTQMVSDEQDSNTSEESDDLEASKQCPPVAGPEAIFAAIKLSKEGTHTWPLDDHISSVVALVTKLNEESVRNILTRALRATLGVGNCIEVPASSVDDDKEHRPETLEDIRNLDPANLRSLDKFPAKVLKTWRESVLSTADLLKLFFFGVWAADSCQNFVDSLDSKYLPGNVGNLVNGSSRLLWVGKDDLEKVTSQFAELGKGFSTSADVFDTPLITRSIVRLMRIEHKMLKEEKEKTNVALLVEKPYHGKGEIKADPLVKSWAISEIYRRALALAEEVGATHVYLPGIYFAETVVAANHQDAIVNMGGEKKMNLVSDGFLGPAYVDSDGGISESGVFEIAVKNAPDLKNLGDIKDKSSGGILIAVDRLEGSLEAGSGDGFSDALSDTDTHSVKSVGSDDMHAPASNRSKEAGLVGGDEEHDYSSISLD